MLVFDLYRDPPSLAAIEAARLKLSGNPRNLSLGAVPEALSAAVWSEPLAHGKTDDAVADHGLQGHWSCRDWSASYTSDAYVEKVKAMGRDLVRCEVDLLITHISALRQVCCRSTPPSHVGGQRPKLSDHGLRHYGIEDIDRFFDPYQEHQTSI